MVLPPLGGTFRKGHMDDYPERQSGGSEGRTPAAKLPRTPSWVMLGFVLGVLFMWLLGSGTESVELTGAHKGSGHAGAGAVEGGASPGKDEQGKRSAAAVVTAPVRVAPKPRVLSTVEAVFEEWGKYAVWDRNRTELALWSPDKGAYADFYEVYRDEDVLYFRSITQLTRPLLALPDRPDAPIVFTETEAMRREREAARRALVPAHPEAPSELLQPQVDIPSK